jgi:hypothetical protein
MNIPPEQQFKANPSLYINLGPQLIRYIRQLEHNQHMTTLRPIQFEYRKYTPAVTDPYSPAKWETIPMTGHFHSFSTEGDGSEIGPVAIIETPDGQIYTPAAFKCKFLDTEPAESSVKTSDTI